MDSPRFLINKKDGLTPDILISRGLNGSLLTLPSYLYLVITKSRFRSSAQCLKSPAKPFSGWALEQLRPAIAGYSCS